MSTTVPFHREHGCGEAPAGRRARATNLIAHTESLTLERAMEHRPAVELLQSTHSFPGEFKIKAIGSADDDFESRVVDAVSALLPARSDLDYSVRTTPGGRHIAITLDLTVQTAEQVLAIYAELQGVKGITHLF